MKKNVKYLLILVLLLFLFPIKSEAKTSQLTYGISKIMIKDETMAVSGWAYKTFEDFCNVNNETYESYKMTNVEEVLIEDKNDPKYGEKVQMIVEKGVASRCKDKGYNSVIYRLVLQPDNGNAVRIYARSKDGNMQNMRTQGVSATCVDYYKPSIHRPVKDSNGRSIYDMYGREQTIGYSVHCDGMEAPFGEFPSDQINYTQRNYNVQNRVNWSGDGTYFYDDIGFVGIFDLSDVVENVSYTLYLEIVRNGAVERFPVAAPGIIVSSQGYNAKSETSKITIKSDYFDYILNYSPNVGMINQEATTVYWFDSGSLAQRGPAKGGGYFMSYKEYDINKVLEFKDATSVKGNPARLGGFDFYNLGTTGEFANDHTSPGNNYTYYAISPWVAFSGVIVLYKNRTTECGGTEELSEERKLYCNKYPKPGDYDVCCICGGTLPDTDERKLYCDIDENKNDSFCCDNKNQCPPTTNDKLVPVIPTKYTYWDLSATEEETGYRVVSGNTSIKDYPKYCAGTDKTVTMVTTDDMLRQSNNAFCYQTGSFTSNSPNKKDYILTYAGGAYSLSVKYNTELVCARLEQRTVEEIKYYDQDCSYRGSSEDDEDLYFNDEQSPANWPTLSVNKFGKFDIEELKPTLQKIPTIILSDTTSNQNKVGFAVSIKFSDVSKSEYTTSSLVYQHIKKLKDKDKSFVEPLGGKQNDINTSKTFVEKVVVSKDIYEELGDYDCSDDSTSDCTPDEVKNFKTSLEYTDDHYYGILTLESEVLESYQVNNDEGTYYYTNYKYWYEGNVVKTMYVTIKDKYFEDVLDMEATYTIPADAVPSTIRDRFETNGEKYVSQVNLSDYYQITISANDYNLIDGQYFGVAGTWNMDKTLCALDVTDHKCDPEKDTCACKYDDRGNLERGIHYSECLDFRVVSVTSLFPGRSSSLCVNPTSNCRQPGRNWLYVSNEFKKTDNFDYTEDKPMYHITLNPSTMNKIASDYKEYYTNIDLGSWYDPSKCTYNGNSRCSSDYESSILNGLGSSVFTRNYDIINTRYRKLKNMTGVNIYETTKYNGGD